MDVESTKIGDLTEDPANVRTHGSPNVEAIKRSLARFGQQKPIVATDAGVVIAGNGTLRAAVALGWDEIDVVRTSLTAVETVAYAIADNRTAELAEWDDEGLAATLRALVESPDIDLEDSGFSDDDLAELLADIEGDIEAVEDEPPEPPDEPVTRPGDLWVLGDHRLLCGDSSRAEDLDRLLDGASIDLVNTDPPYNVKVEPRSNNAMAAGRKGLPSPDQSKRIADRSMKVTKMRAKDRPLDNDSMSDEAFNEVLAAWLGNIGRVLKPGGSFYIWGAGFPPDIDSLANTETFPTSLRAAGLAYAHLIIWDKGHGVLGRKDFMTQYEVCFYGWRRGASHKFFGPNNATDLWHVKKVNPQSMVHLTEKPVELAVRAVQFSSRPSENILDLFGGSGSTLIACEQTDRHAYLMEIDPAYCDVIVQRWENLTGDKATRVDADGEAQDGMAA